MSNITIRYNVTGAERKRLADYIAGFLGCEKKYLGVPSCAYRVGFIEVSKDGTITFDERAESEDTKALRAELEQEGFHAEPADEDKGKRADNDNSDTAALCIQLPKEYLNEHELELLHKIVEGKASLIKKATGADSLKIIETESVICFPWYEELPDQEMVTAVSTLITQLVGFVKGMKRISLVDHEVENEKYAFRCFLLRLGFIGEDYKKDRKVLLRNLKGSTAFKTSSKAEETK